MSHGTKMGLVVCILLLGSLVAVCPAPRVQNVAVGDIINLPTPTQGMITIKGIGISETEIKVSDLHKLPSVTREVTSHKGTPREITFEVTGPLLDTVLMEKLGLSQKTIDRIRLSALDGYSIEVPKHILQNREIILAYLTNCEKYTGGEWRAFTEGDEYWPIRVVVPDERAMFWVRMLNTIEIIDTPDELNINQIVLFETKVATLNQIPCSENTYKVVRNNEFFKDALKQGYEFVRLKSVDSLDRNEELETFNNAYIRITGEDAPRFYSPDLPRGMHVRYLFHFSAGNTTYFVLSRAFERLDTKTIEGKEGLPLTVIIEEVGVKESNQYILNAVDGTYITVTRNELTKGIVYKKADGTVSIIFEGLPEYSLNGLLSINAKE